MKISVDNDLVLELNETQKKVLCNEITDEEFDKDMKRRVKWVLTHKYEQCFDRLKKEWEPKLAKKYESIPTDPEKFAQLVFEQPEYKNRSQKEKERKEKEKAELRGQ